MGIWRWLFRSKDRKSSVPMKVPPPSCEQLDDLPAAARPAEPKLLPPEKKSDDTLRSGSYLQNVNRPLFIDVETTGLHSSDQIVSISMILVEKKNDHSNNLKIVNFIFDPLKKSHKDAERIHGIDDWTLRHQEVFVQRLDEIRDLLNECDAIIAHNAAFDIPFVKRSFEMCGQKMPEKPIYCTMIEARSQGFYPASLSACAERIGIHRKNTTHDAFEDAFMCMALWLYWVRGQRPRSDFEFPSWQNFIEPPCRPDILPRRNNVIKRTNFYQKLPGATS